MDECNEVMAPSMSKSTIKDICNDYIDQAFQLGYEVGYKAYKRENDYQQIAETIEDLTKRYHELLEQEK